MLEEWRSLGRTVKIVKPVGGPHIPPTEVAVPVAVNVVRSRLGDHIKYNVSGLSVFRVVIIGQNLEFLYFFHGRAEGVAPGNKLVGDVSAIQVNGDAA